jgi:hypothetical protein
MRMVPECWGSDLLRPCSLPPWWSGARLPPIGGVPVMFTRLPPLLHWVSGAAPLYMVW